MTTQLRSHLILALCTILALVAASANGATPNPTWSTNSHTPIETLLINAQQPLTQTQPRSSPSNSTCEPSKPYYEKVSKLCYESCPVGFLTVQTPLKSCENCSANMQHCTSCASKDICKACLPGYEVNQTLNGCVKSRKLTHIRKLQQCPDGTFLLGSACMSSCPNQLWADQTTRQCLDGCWIVGALTLQSNHSCVSICPAPYFAQQSNLLCVLQCPAGLYGDPTTRNCSSSCMTPGHFGDGNQRLCVKQCSSGLFGSELMGNYCVTHCPSPTFGSPTNQMCVLQCPAGYFASTGDQMCVTQCPGGLFSDNSSRQCLGICNTGTFGDMNTRQCVQTCPVGTFGDQMMVACLSQCMMFGFYGDVITRTCVTTCPANFYSDFNQRLCVRECAAPLFADASSFKCTPHCPYGTYGDSFTAKCVQTCPASANTYGDNATGICVNSCIPGSFGQNSTRICVSSCWGQSYADMNTSICVGKCPLDFFGNQWNWCMSTCSLPFYGDFNTRICVLQCPSGYYRQNSTATCVADCSAEPDTFADNVTKYCVFTCSSGTFGDKTTLRCVEYCPTGNFAYIDMFVCVQECPVPYYGEPTTKSCVLTCPAVLIQNDTTRKCDNLCSTGMWADMATMTCVNECPTGTFKHGESLSCVLLCPKPYFGDPAVGKCVQRCSGDGFYGNPETRMCVVSSECNPRFGDNETKLCSTTCSAGQWPNENGYRCDPCHPLCKQCGGPELMNCIKCMNDTFYLVPNIGCLTCSQPCSSCLNSTSCLTCMDGFYFTGTNLCQACNPNCITCTGYATNCSSCAPDRKRTMNSSCDCLSGFEDPQGNCASPCTDSACDSCTTDKNVCTQCKASFVVMNGSCKCPASTFLNPANNMCTNCHPLCVQCSGSMPNQCTSCNPEHNRQLNKNTSTCDCKVSFYAPNNQATCIKQPMPSCPSGFVHDAEGVYCVQICGDGILHYLECDDGNFDNFDGCDLNCKIEANFSCSNEKMDEPTTCSYIGQIIFELISALKDKFGNIIKLEYRMIPKLKFFKMFPDFKKTLKISQTVLRKKAQRQIPITSSESNTTSSFSIISALYSSDSQTLLVDVGYNETASGKTVKVSYTPEDSPYSHAMDETSYEWSVQVSNGLSLIYYPDDVYSQARTINTLTMAIYTGSLCLFALTIFFRKMIGIEMILLIQAQVLSMSMLSEIHPTLGVLTTDKYAFGYNQLDELMDLKVPSGSQTVGLYKAINFSLVFGENVNIMFFIVCALYVLAAILRLVAIRKQNEAGEKLKKTALVIARQIAFGFLLFSIMNMVTSYALESYSWQIWNFAPTYSGVIKIVGIITIIANYIVYSMNFKDSIESLVFYIRNSKVSQLQPLFITTKAILVAVLIALYTYVGVQVIYALMALQVAYIVLIAVIKPFSKGVDMVRSIIIELSLLFIFISRYVLIGYINLEEPGDWTGFLDSGLLAEHVVIALSLLVSLVSFIFHLFKANGQISPEQGGSQNPEEKKVRQMNESNIEIHHYIQDDIEGDSKKKNSGYGKTFRSSKAKFHNSSTLQMINLSDGDGYDSKRKLNQSGLGESMEVIQMDE